MKNILRILVFALSLSCKGNTEDASLKKYTVKTHKIERKTEPEPTITAKPVIIADPKISSIIFTSTEIKGGNEYGFEYDFTIKIDNSVNLDILRFCKANFSQILNKRVKDLQVIQSILNEVNSGNADIDKNPTGLRLGASTVRFDTIDVEIYLKENNVLKMNVKYYYPL